MINKKNNFLYIFFIFLIPLFSCNKQKDYTGMSWIKPGEFMMGGMNHFEAYQIHLKVYQNIFFQAVFRLTVVCIFFQL